MNESQAIDALSALSQETRLQMLRFLVARGAEGAPAGEIGAAVGSSSSRSSFHLSALTRAGLLTATKQSRQVIYRANFAALGALVGYLVQDCCGGHAQVLACCQPGAGCCGTTPQDPV